MKLKITQLMKQLILILVISMHFFVIPGGCDDVKTTVSVHPETLSVSPNETFVLTIMCAPVQSMKSFELSLSYDQNILEAKNVEEGTIFDGYTTFFNQGIIDNTDGKITSIYSLILGPGNVSESGSLVLITFTANTSVGSTEIVLYNVGITNESTYIPITVSNGVVSIQHTPPWIHDVSLAHSEPVDTSPLFGWFNFSSVVYDAIMEDVFLLLTYPCGSQSTFPMTKLTDTLYFYNLSGLSHGSYSYSIVVHDILGEHVFSEQYFFVVPPNWDVTMDGMVSILDLLFISNQFGQTGYPGWVREDVNNDGVIDLLDMMFVSGFYNIVW